MNQDSCRRGRLTSALPSGLGLVFPAAALCFSTLDRVFDLWTLELFLASLSDLKTLTSDLDFILSKLVLAFPASWSDSHF